MGDKSAYSIHNTTLTTSIIAGVADYSSDSATSDDESEKLDTFSQKKVYFNWTLASVHHSISFI